MQALQFCESTENLHFSPSCLSVKCADSPSWVSQAAGTKSSHAASFLRFCSRMNIEEAHDSLLHCPRASSALQGREAKRVTLCLGHGHDKRRDLCCCHRWWGEVMTISENCSVVTDEMSSCTGLYSTVAQASDSTSTVASLLLRSTSS